MSRFIKDWLVSNEEKAESAPVIIQDGDTPKDDFSAASADDASDVETDKPAVADLPAASEGAPKATVKDQGHQTISVSAEGDEKDLYSTGELNQMISNEAFVGGLLGFLGTSVVVGIPFVGTAVHGALRVERIKLREDIQTIAKRIEKVRNGQLTEAKAKKMTLPDGIKDVDWVEVLKSSLLGTFFGPLYGIRQGSQIEDLNKELQKKLGELEESLKKSGISTETYAEYRASIEEAETDKTDLPTDTEADAGDEPKGDDVAKIEADEGNGSGDTAPEGVDETVTADDAEVTQVDEPADEAPEDDVEKDESDADEKDESDDSDETDEHEGERPARDDGDDGRDEDDLDDGREGYEEHEGTLDSPLENAMEASRNVEAVGEDVDALMRVTESLEAYHTLLARSLKESDGISALTADMVRVGLESLDVSLGGTSVVLGMEAFGEHSSQRMATRLSMEGVGDAIKTTVEAAKKAIKRLFEMLYDAFNQVMNGVGRAKTRLAAVVKELKDAPSSLGAVETSVSGAGRLTLDGKFAGNDADAVKLLTNVTNYMYDIYPKSCVALARNMDKEFKSAAKNGTIEERQRVHGMLTAAFKTQPWETVGQDPKDEAKVTSAELPGGWKLERRIADVPKSSSSKAFNVKTTAYSFKENFDIRFETDSSIKSGESTAKYTTPNAAGMKTLITALEGLITAAEQNKQAAVNYKLLGKHFSDYHQQIDYSADDGSVSQMFYYDMSRVMTRPAGPFNGYIGRTLNAYISILEHNLSAMKKAATPASDQKALPAS